ncbi:NUDIX domain-containing protein [Streptomyces sp. NPDC001401]|uniref:NUDIX domain-containing protein n=1 Tax=Streptomyces sp. NPDC001401 TaxID=3364570 RepID=UPI0036B3EB29
MKIRQKAVCCIRRADAFLFTVRHDGEPPETTFFIPPGGMIESGEKPGDAATREAQEELGCHVPAWDSLGVQMDEFTFRGERCRETVHIFAAPLPPDSRIGSHMRESNGDVHPLRWFTTDQLRTCHLPVYPPGLPEVLSRYVASR